MLSADMQLRVAPQQQAVENARAVIAQRGNINAQGSNGMAFNPTHHSTQLNCVYSRQQTLIYMQI